MADLADLKSPHTAGHSRGVANLAAEAARRRPACPAPRWPILRRAGLVHDLGRLGVSNAIWDKPARSTDAECERVRLHPYLTDRMLARVDRARRRPGRSPPATTSGSTAPATRAGLTAAALTPADRCSRPPTSTTR